LDQLVALHEHAGAVQHVASFWRYRFPDVRATACPEELMDIFLDFAALGQQTRRLDVA